MVRGRQRRLSERGTGRTGCLLSILVIVAVAYFGVPVAGTYIRFYRFRNEMQTQARFAPSIDDSTIRRRLLQTIDELGLPDSARNFRIRRGAREILITSSWQEPIELPFYTIVITLHPEVRARM